MIHALEALGIQLVEIPLPQLWRCRDDQPKHMNNARPLSVPIRHGAEVDWNLGVDRAERLIDDARARVEVIELAPLP